MRISDDRYDRDMRRYELAWRMMRHDARTANIVRWTGLSKYRVQTLGRNYRVSAELIRHRGAAPFQPMFFCRTLFHESEGAAFATVALRMQVISAQADLQELASVARGERLMGAFDLYRLLVPSSRITLDHALLLVTELTHRQSIDFGVCEECKALMLNVRVGPPQTHCSFCRRR